MNIVCSCPIFVCRFFVIGSAFLTVPCLAAPKPKTVPAPKPSVTAPKPQMVEPASLKTHTTLQVTEEVSYLDAIGAHSYSHKARVSAARENQFRIDTLPSPGDPYVGTVTACDGKTVTIYNSEAKTFTHYPFHLQAGYTPDQEITEGYFPIKAKPSKLKGRIVLYARIDGTEPVRAPDGTVTGKAPQRMEWWFDPQTKLPIRSIVYRMLDAKLREFYRKDYSDWIVDKPLDPATFTFTPPAGAKEIPGTE